MRASWILAFGACHPDEPAPVDSIPSTPTADTDTGEVGGTTPTPVEPPLAVTGAATSLGTAAFSVNGRVQPRGAPGSYSFEYGPTTDYGRATPVRPLGPRKAAHYVEGWDESLASWRGGFLDDLAWVSMGGYADGFVRYSEPTSTDSNHLDGIGELHLVQYFYPGIFEYLDFAKSAFLGGGDPDFTDAGIELWVRGVDWDDRHPLSHPEGKPPFWRGDELVWWSQADATAYDDFTHMSNWAYTGFTLTDALYSGEWERVSYTLANDSTQWTYAGQNHLQYRDVYVYHPIGEVQRHLNVDVFHNLILTDYTVLLQGQIDLDELHITYRNHSVLLDTNGGTSTAAPADGGDPAALTDGYRFGDGHTWQSAANPSAPQQFDWALADPVVVSTVQIHNDPALPSADIDVYTSLDGAEWTPLVSGRLPRETVLGDNFLFLRASGLAQEARYVRLVVQSGWQPEGWGLGEVELFGTGAVEGTDDDWYNVTDDVTGLVAGETVHWRLVANVGGEEIVGEDRVYVVPTGDVPEVVTLPAVTVDPERVRIAATINTLGKSGTWWFELGADESYGLSTSPAYTGPEITPRRFLRTLDLGHPDLASIAGGPIHYRVVLCLGCDTADPKDDTTWTGADAVW